MSDKIKKALEDFQRVAAEVRSARAFDRDDATRDVGKALDNMGAATAVTRAEAETLPETVQAALDNVLKQLQAAIDAIQAVGQETAEAQEEIKSLRAQQRKMLDAGNKFKFHTGTFEAGAFSPELHAEIMATPSKDPVIRKMQAQNDALVIMGAIMEHAILKGRARGDDSMPFRAADGKRVRNIRETRVAQAHQAMLRAMYSTGAAVGDEFVPTLVSAQVYEHYEASRRVAAHIERVQMPSNPWVIPATISDPTFYIAGERTSDPGAALKSSDMGTAGRTLTAIKLAARVLLSTELDEDSIVAILPLLQSRLGKAWASHEEDALLNGDTSASHQDTGLSVGADSHLKAWIGLRRAAVVASSTVNLSSFTDATFLGLCGTMGDHAPGVGPEKTLCVPSARTFTKYILASSMYYDLFKVMAMMAATNTQGVSGMYYNSMVVPSTKLRDDNNTSGVYDNSTKTTGGVLVVNPAAWVIGERKGMSIRVVEDIEADQMVLVARVREVAAKLEATTVKSEAYGYNIT